MKIMRPVIILILVLTAKIYVSANVVPGSQDDSILIGDTVEYLEDDKNLRFNDILHVQSGWKKSKLHHLNFGFSDATCWLRFTLENKTGKDIYLSLNTVMVDTINLYLPDKDGYTLKEGGDLIPVSRRELRVKEAYFKIPWSPGPKTIYLETRSKYLLACTPQILTVPGLVNREYIRLPAYWTYYGIMIAILLYNLFIFFSIRERSYFYFITVLLFYIVLETAQDGFATLFLFPENPAIADKLFVTSCTVVGMAMGLFFQEILETCKKFRKIHFLFYSYIILYFVLFVLSFFSDKSLMKYFYVVVEYTTLVNLGILVYLSIKKSRAARIILAAYLVRSTSLILASLATQNVFIDFFPLLSNVIVLNWMPKIGASIFIIALGITLADRINVIKANLEIGEKTYRTIFNGAHEAIYLLDINTHIITDANSSMLSLFNAYIDEILGKTNDFFSVTEEGFNSEILFSRLAETPAESPLQMEWLYRKMDGKKFWAELNISRVNIHGKDKHMIVMRDISERKNAEMEKEKMVQQLTQSQKMEAVGSLSSGLAHDFNNILTGILGSSSLLENQLKKETVNKEIISKYIIVIKEASIKAAATVRRLLTLSRKNEFDFTSVDLNTSIKNVEDICRNSFPKSVEIKIEYLDTPATVTADRSSIEQVLLNIFVNASHAMTIMKKPGGTRGGILEVKVGKQVADEQFCKENHDAVKGTIYVTIQISDTGCGMDKDTRSRIFNPFFTTKTGGTGLGLSMAYSIIREHNGFIMAYSEIDKGTTFTIYLPERKGPVSPEKPSEDESLDGRGTILVVDDEDFVRTIAGDILSSAGYNILSAAGGLEGIEIYKNKKETIDAVLLDTSMPGFSGIDTFKEIKKINNAANIIMSSGFSLDERAKEAMELGARAFIQKPYTSTQLITAVNNVIMAAKTTQ